MAVVIIIGIIGIVALIFLSEEREKARFRVIEEIVDKKTKHNRTVSAPKNKNAMKYDCKMYALGKSGFGQVTLIIESDRVTISSLRGTKIVYHLESAPSNYCSVQNGAYLQVHIVWTDSGATVYIEGSQLMNLVYDKYNPTYI